MSIIGTVMTL